MTDTPPDANLETLYCEHHRWLQSWLRKKLGNDFDAADLTHDTFERLLARRGLPPMRDARAFLVTVARGLVVNHWRRQEVQRAYLDTLAAQPEPLARSPEDEALLVEALCEIDTLLATLNPKARMAFLLAQLDGLSYTDIARRLDVSERMVKKYMARAMLQCLKSGLQTH